MCIVENNLFPPPGAKIIIAMSGGVDSAAAAARLVSMGYHCMGITLRMLADDASPETVFEPCCGIKAAEDARRFCERIGIPHRTLRVVEPFQKHIIAQFAREYVQGRTPNPCIRCNRIIKFGLLLREARQLGYSYIAMGHYARLVYKQGRFALRRAVYAPKDQSYVLAPLVQSQLRHTCFPLGDIDKNQARQIVSQIDSSLSQKYESQEICFVKNRNYIEVVEANAQHPGTGYFYDMDGNILGRHKGIHAYTIGQRRGLGVSSERPLYVVRIDKETNSIFLGRDEESLCASFTTGPLVWGGRPPQSEPFYGYVQIRYRHIPVRATVYPDPKQSEIVLSTPQRSVTPGQWAVLYDEEGYVVTSGIIKTFNPLLTPPRNHCSR